MLNQLGIWSLCCLRLSPIHLSGQQTQASVDYFSGTALFEYHTVLPTGFEADQEYPADLARLSRSVLEGRGFPVTYREFEGGHHVPPAFLLREIVDWIGN
ncbi:MAG: hypothetical protein ABIF09_16720 [Gemmatimonadota bacterium]